jgi:hypothetical protein
MLELAVVVCMLALPLLIDDVVFAPVDVVPPDRRVDWDIVISNPTMITTATTTAVKATAVVLTALR